MGTTVADGSSRAEVLVPEGELETTTGGGAEAAKGTLESRRATAQEMLVIFEASNHNLNTSSRLYTQKRTLAGSEVLGPQLTQS